VRPDPRSMPAKRREGRSAPVRLRRYDLPGVTSFRCVRCGRNKSGPLAIENDDLTQVVCSDCYDAAHAAEQQEPPVRGKPGRPKPAVPVQSASRQEPPAHRKPVEPEAAVPAQSARAKRAAAETRSLIDFFRDAGIRANITKLGHLSVNDVVCEDFGPAKQIPGAWTRGWRREVDAIAWHCASDLLKTAIRRQARLKSRFRVVAVPREYGFAIKLGRESVALIRATGAVLPGGSDISGNFLAGGSHWMRLAKAADSIGRQMLEGARRRPNPADVRPGQQPQLPEPADSRPEWQRQHEASLQKQRKAWERRQRANEELQRLRQAQASNGATPLPAGPAAETQERAQDAAERPPADIPTPPGAARLLEFFTDAGVSASVVRPGGRLVLNGKETGRLLGREDDPQPWSPAWRDAVDQLTWVHARDALRRAVTDNARLGAGDRVTAAADENGFAITRGGQLLAVILATRCSRPGNGNGPLLGNFLTSGDHWDELARHLETTAAQAPPALSPGRLTRRIDDLPGDLPTALFDACIEACRRIRAERRVAFERPVVLANSHGELTVRPIIGVPSALSVPFSYRASPGPIADPVQGRLLLDRRDPMPVIVAENINDDDAHKAWITMLLGFADLTCNSPEPATPRHPSTRRKPTPEKDRPGRRGSPDPVPSRRSWAGPLEPAGKWIEQGGSYVAAHVRNLSEGHHGPEARDRALQVGIILKPHETWVRDYVRGVPEGTEIRFRWNAPAELTSYL
jgi:hypothetical protein